MNAPKEAEILVFLWVRVGTMISLSYAHSRRKTIAFEGKDWVW